MEPMSTQILLATAALAIGLGVGVWVGRRVLGGTDGDSANEAKSLRLRLQRAQRMEALGILSGSIMHNLNNLLSVVLGQTRLARDEMPDNERAQHHLSQVIRAAEAAAELSREVDSYQSEADHAREPVRLQPVVRSTVKLLHDILPDTIRLETDLDSSCGLVLASTTQIQQVLMSLCSNATHAMYRRHGRISISMATTEIFAPRAAVPRDLAPGVYVQLSVADNGRGMDSDTLRHIFEPYFSHRAPRHGAGLGLTMVTRLLTANEGVTIPSSLPGHGTRFDLYFPLIARRLPKRDRNHAPRTTVIGHVSLDPGTAEAEYEAPAATAVDPIDEPIPSRPVHVLLVEDDIMVAETVQTCLERAGMRVSAHEDGAAAVTAFSEAPGRFDLLLTDQFMRGLDGLEVAVEIRRFRPRLPIILMSGHPEGIRLDELNRLAINGSLAKPFSPSQLLETIKAVLAAAPKAREGQA